MFQIPNCIRNKAKPSSWQINGGSHENNNPISIVVLFSRTFAWNREPSAGPEGRSGIGAGKSRCESGRFWYDCDYFKCCEDTTGNQERQKKVIYCNHDRCFHKNIDNGQENGYRSCDPRLHASGSQGLHEAAICCNHNRCFHETIDRHQEDRHTSRDTLLHTTGSKFPAGQRQASGAIGVDIDYAANRLCSPVPYFDTGNWRHRGQRARARRQIDGDLCGAILHAPVVEPAVENGGCGNGRAGTGNSDTLRELCDAAV